MVYYLTASDLHFCSVTGRWHQRSRELFGGPLPKDIHCMYTHTKSDLLLAKCTLYHVFFKKHFVCNRDLQVQVCGGKRTHAYSAFTLIGGEPGAGNGVLLHCSCSIGRK